ncbi:hypothetical protein BJY00DRAFT_280790 [Aspergillus carlsbadensis]|nr:hypothetical protein BJY00DRAFT_280790 [Aspergillus carlsbadensis]
MSASTQQARRRPHTKSRQGCIRCKQKHVKCDEARPTCSTCVRYDVPCAYPPRKPPGATSRARGQEQGGMIQDISPGATAASSNSASASPAPAPVAVAVAAPEVASSLSLAHKPHQPRSSLTFWEFELMHHWIVNVSDSFDISPGFHRVFRDELVGAATRFEFFMHMLLILSALHLSLTKSPKFTERHRAFILQGCSDAMAAFQLEATNITEENCEEIQAFHSLVAIYALALAQFDRNEKTDREETVVDEIVQILILIKANRAIKDTAQPIVDAKRENRWVVDEDVFIDSDGYPGDDELVDAVTNLQPWIDSADDAEAVRALNTRAATLVADTTSYRLRRNLRLFVWPNFVDDEFLGLVTRRNPIALVILAHYAVVLDQSRALWWCGQWGARIIAAVASSLPERFRPAMAYPLRTVGLV